MFLFRGVEATRPSLREGWVCAAAQAGMDAPLLDTGQSEEAESSAAAPGRGKRPRKRKHAQAFVSSGRRGIRKTRIVMHEFRYINDEFYCEKVRVEDLARKYGTPLYVYSYHTFIGHFLKLRAAFRDVRPLICYSVKANSNLSILKALVARGAGLDIVSGGELYRALLAGCPANRIVYASVGKTEPEIAEAIRRRILFFNVESVPELEAIDRAAVRLRRSVNVCLRINPDVEPKTHTYITTGKLTNKFGLDFESCRRILTAGREGLRRTMITGLHIHIGSQITEAAPYIAALTKMVRFVDDIRSLGIGIEYLNIGGGLGIVYDREEPQTAQDFASRTLSLLKRTGLKIIMEPGRFIIGQAGILVARLVYIKQTPFKRFYIVDAAMNDLIRPALYEAHHAVLPLRRDGGARPARTETVDIVGPICESGDFLAKKRRVPRMQEGDYCAVMTAGAYGASMSSNYNSRLKAAEVLVTGETVKLIRRRDSYKDLVRNEFV